MLETIMSLIGMKEVYLAATTVLLINPDMLGEDVFYRWILDIWEGNIVAEEVFYAYYREYNSLVDPQDYNSSWVVPGYFVEPKPGDPSCKGTPCIVYNLEDNYPCPDVNTAYVPKPLPPPSSVTESDVASSMDKKWIEGTLRRVSANRLKSTVTVSPNPLTVRIDGVFTYAFPFLLLDTHQRTFSYPLSTRMYSSDGEAVCRCEDGSGNVFERRYRVEKNIIEVNWGPFREEYNVLTWFVDVVGESGNVGSNAVCRLVVR